MRQTPERHSDLADRTIKDIRHKTRKRYSLEDTIAELCRQEGIAQTQYYSWSMEFMGEPASAPLV